MLNRAEIAQGLSGALRLARGDASGITVFPADRDGFWRSFQVAFLVAPPYALLLWADFSLRDPAPDAMRFVLVEAIAYVIGWFAYPLLMVTISRILERELLYFRYICAYNWSAVVILTITLPVALLEASEIAPDGLVSLLRICALILVMGYQWFVSQTGLAIGRGAALMVVVIDLLLSLLVNGAAETLLKATPAG